MNEDTTKDWIRTEGIQSTLHLLRSNPAKRRSVPKTWGIGSTILGSIQHVKKKGNFCYYNTWKRRWQWI